MAAHIGKASSLWSAGRPLRFRAMWAGTVLMCLLGLAAPARATFTEQMAIDAKSIALANTVTADPPGVMAIHYNPAGLSLLPVGKYFTMGATIPIIKITSYYDADPNFGGFFGGYNDDPLNHTQGTNSSGRMYVPILNKEINFLVSPVLGVSYRPPNSRWSFAIGNYTPFAVGFAHDDPNDPVRFGAKYAYEQHFVYMAPSVSYQLTDTLSAGVTVGVGQTALGVATDMRSPNDLVALTRVLGDATKDLEIPILSELTFPPPWFGGGIGPYDQVASMQLTLRDDFSPNYNVGLLWRPWQWISLGLVYQSPIKAQLTGRYRFDYTEQFQKMINWLGSSPTLLMLSGMLNLPFKAVPTQTGTVYSDVTFPQRVQMGIKVKPFKRLSLLADLHWANWSVLKEDRFVFDQDIQLLQLVKVLGYTGGNRELVLKRDFKDTWNWSFGLEFDLTDWLTLMLGYEHRPSSVSLNYFDNIYSLPDLDDYAAGLSFKFKNGTRLNLAFAYLVNENFEVPDNTSHLMNSTNPFEPVYNPYAGLNYRQKTETYMGSFEISMPLEVMSSMLDDVFALLNPFSSGKKHVHGRITPVSSGGAAVESLAAAGQEPPVEAKSAAAPPEVHEYTLELGRFASPERALLGMDFYRGENITPQLRATRQVSGVTRWTIQFGRFDSVESARAYRKYYGLSEADVRPMETSAGLTVRYALRLARFDTIDRARMAADFYRLQGLAVRVRPAGQGYAVETGDFESEAQARRFGRTRSLSEAEVVPFAR